jgi:hypothetical protein
MAAYAAGGGGAAGQLTGTGAFSKAARVGRGIAAKIKVAIAVGALAAVGCGVAIANYGNKEDDKIHLNDYMIIETDGYDSIGTADCYFDKDAFLDDYEGKLEYRNKEYAEELGVDDVPEEMLLSFAVSYHLDKTSNLNNGDVITVEWNCDDDWAYGAFGCELEYSDIEYTVSNLKEIGSMNPFDYIDVSFDGIAPDAELVITKNESREVMEYISFTADKDDKLSIGERVTITASTSCSESDFAEMFGLKLGTTERSYWVENIPSYVMDVNDIPTEFMQKMEDKGADIINENEVIPDEEKEDMSEEERENLDHLDSITCLGNYFFSLDSDYSSSTYNYIYMIYDMKITQHATGEVVDLYYYVEFYNLMLDEDGVCDADLDNYTIPFSWWGFAGEIAYINDAKYLGYDNLDSLLEHCEEDNYRYRGVKTINGQ